MEYRRLYQNRWLALALGVVGLALLAGALLVVVRTGGSDGNAESGTLTGFSSGPSATATPTATATPSSAPLDHLVIPAIDVDAPISVKGVDADGVMQSPNGPWDASWYDITARPGTGGNAVFSGHVNYVGVGPAVFARLGDLQRGDALEVRLADGTVYRYQVSESETVPADIDANEIISKRAVETVTLITCSGDWIPSIRQYDSRLVVRAVRVP